VELSFCAIVAIFETTAKMNGMVIWVALQEIEGVKTLWDQQSQCMVHVRSLQIPAQIMQAQCAFL
jgi:hypothetical protein